MAAIPTPCFLERWATLDSWERARIGGVQRERVYQANYATTEMMKTVAGRQREHTGDKIERQQHFYTTATGSVDSGIVTDRSNEAARPPTTQFKSF